MNISIFLAPEILKAYEEKVPASEIPLWKYWEEFVEKYLRTGKSEVTLMRVRDSLRFAIRRLDILTVEAMNNHRLVENALFAYKDKEHISSATYNTYRKNFNIYFIWLYKHDYISINNFSKVDRCIQPINEQYALSELQVKAIVAHVHDRRQTRLQRLRNSFFIDLLRFTAARPCELLEIRMRDIVKEGDTYKLTLRGKKQKGRLRYYAFPSWMRDSYEAYVEYRSRLRQNEPMLLISSSKQGGWTNKGMRGLFKALSSELGFRVIAYGFRRYAATKMYLANVPLEHIQTYLGHTRIQTTQIYIERCLALTARGAEVMGE